MKRLVALWMAIPMLLAACRATPSPDAHPAPATPIADLPAGTFPTNMPTGRWLAWAPTRRQLLYPGPEPGTIMQVDPTRPTEPGLASSAPALQAAFSPDGRTLAFIGRQEVRLQSEAGTVSIGLPRKGTSGAFFLSAWLDDRTLALEEHMGSGVQELRLLDTATQQLTDPAGAPLAATFFTWAPARDKLIGQGPAAFWVWDRATGKRLSPAAKLPGQSQWFEAWAPDGAALLFTAWAGGFPYADLRGVTLYRWDLATGAVTKVADQAALAAWAGPYIAYVRLGEPLTLVVTRDGQELWTEPLGTLPPDRRQDLQWWYRPVPVGTNALAFHRADGWWTLSPLDRRAPRPLVQGAQVALAPSPEGEYLAVLDGARLRVFAIHN